jgi:DNA-binding CsgD family transcriptional regulator
VAGWLARRAEEQEHPWGLAGTKRCRALIGFATRDKLDEAEAALAEAAAAYRELGLRFDAARSLLILGRAQRRRRKWAAARAALESAAQGFEELSASGWVEETRAELARVGGRQPTPEGALSNTERQVAALAAEGRSNKQIAAELHVTVHTVEKHLSRAYAKLGIQSRRQLPPQLDAAQ